MVLFGVKARVGSFGGEILIAQRSDGVQFLAMPHPRTNTSSNLRNPTPKRRLVAQLRRMLVGAHQGLHQSILGIVVVAAYTHHLSVHRILVPKSQPLEIHFG